MIMTLLYAILAFFILKSSITIVRPVNRVLVERLGKYNRTLDPGFHLIIPIIEGRLSVNITEQMVDVEPQVVITRDKLNVKVDAVVYYKIIDPAAAMYNVDNHEIQLISLTKTTLRAVIGKMTLTDTNESRDSINASVEAVLDVETSTYGVNVLRVEIQKIEPPENVQMAMNDVVKTENMKLSARNEADAAEIRADGQKLAAIKTAEGHKRATEIEADGNANAIITVAKAKAKEIEVINESTKTHFVGQAVEYKKLEVVLDALRDNTKIIIGPDQNIVNVIGDTAGIVPVKSP